MAAIEIALILIGLKLIYSSRGCRDEVHSILVFLAGLGCFVWGLAMSSWLVQLILLIFLLLFLSSLHQSETVM
jgi:hypothetical protein